MTCEHVPDKQISDLCELLPDWTSCDSCSGEKFAGYSKYDGCVKFCVDGKIYFGISLTDKPNKDHPIDGITKTSPTWFIGTLCSLLMRPIVKNCAGKIFYPWTELGSFVGCDEVGNGLSWNEETEQWDVIKNKDCAGNTIEATDPVVACRNMGSGLVWNKEKGQWEIGCYLKCDEPIAIWSDPGASFSGGICFYSTGAPSGLVLQGRDNTVIYGDPALVADRPLGYQQMTVTNPFNVPAKLKATMQIRNNVADAAGGVPAGTTVKFVHTLGETLNVGFDSGGGSSSPIGTNWSYEEVEIGENDFVGFWGRYSQQTGSLFYERMLAPNETTTLYGQWWIIFYSAGIYLLHPMMHVSYEITRNVQKVA